MHQPHGFVEFRQLGEWYGVVDVGALLVPNSSLGLLLFETADSLGQTQVPPDASVAWHQQADAILSDASAVVMLQYEQFHLLHGPNGRDELLEGSSFLVLERVCDVLSRHFGAGNVRLLVYLD